jgi:small subunit ribosomal protein S21
MLVFVVIASSWYDYRLGSMEPNVAKRFIKMLSL